MAIKLMVVSGPNRGATYFLQDGENSFGRAAGNQVVLASGQVSKNHFAIVCQGRKAELRDTGSSNGTFVNGVLAKKRLLQNRDRISAGPFVMEILLPEAPARASAPAFGQAASGGHTGHADIAAPVVEPGQFKLEEEEPKSLLGKYKKKFDDTFLPVLYDFYEKTEFPNLLAIMFGVYAVVNLGFTVYPVLQRSREEVLRQAQHQARYIAEQVSRFNRQAVLERKEGAVYVDFAEEEVNVKEVIVANLEGRILAPGKQLNESYNNSNFLRYKDLLRKNNNLWGKSRVERLADKEEIIAFMPIMVETKQGAQAPGAIVTVIYSTASIALDSGTIGTIYLEALFWSGLLGIVFLYLIYQVSHRPLLKIADDMDRVLKGEGDSVEKKYKNEVLDKLIDGINSALSRISRAGGAAQESGGGDQERMIMDNMMRPVEFLATKAAHPLMMVDLEMRIKAVNHSFEELTGIRDAQGEVIDSVSRDESFPSLLKEMAGNAAAAGNDGVRENYDFNSGTHQITCVALAGIPGRPEAYLFLFEKQED